MLNSISDYLDQRSVALLNGKVITIDPSDNITEAVLLFGDRIVKAGSNDEIKEMLPQYGTVIDLNGKTVIPGIIDGHVHLELTVNSAMNAVNVHSPPFESLEQMFNAIKERALETPKGEWIIARASNVFPKKIREGRLPTRLELDAISTEHPIIINQEIHITVMNTMAIEKMGWTQESWLPNGATLGRDLTNGELSGVFTEVWDHLPLTPWGYNRMLEALKVGTSKYFVSRGVTSAHELPYTTDGIKGWQQLRDEGNLPLRLKLYITHPSVMEIDHFLQSGFKEGFGDHWLSFGGFKIFVDGIYTHANLHPCEDLKMTQEELDEFLFKAYSAGMHVWAHTLTPTGMKMAITACERMLKRLSRPDHRFRIEHAGDRVFMYDNPDEVLDKMHSLGIIPIMTPQFIHTFFERLGPPLRSMIDKGIKFPGNSDSTGSQPEAYDPWHNIWVTVTRKNYYGQVHAPGECITPLEALRMFTLWAAWGGYEEDIKGSIEPGKLADLVVLGEDPLSVEHDQLREMPVELVLVGGKVMYSSKTFNGALS